MASPPALSDVLLRYLPAYRRGHALSAHQAKVLGSITKCRTAALGGHVCACTECGCTKVFYNSCRDRHCPTCQSLATERWLAGRREELLPVQHYHLVFTLPPCLLGLLRYNERLAYGELFRQAWSSLRTLCADKKYLGARPGMLAVLHTWGQNLHYHPHIHCLVPAGGLSFDGRRWCVTKHQSYLVPVRALSRLFRGRLVGALRILFREGHLRLPPSTSSLRVILDQAMRTEWVVYAKPPFSGPDKLLNYLGRYVKRVAISNQRILGLRQGRVRFAYRDYADRDRRKVMELDVQEFIRRFVQHILPGGFCKVRYYGILATRNRQTRLARCHALLCSEYARRAPAAWRDLYRELTGRDPLVCAHCGSGILVVVDWLKPPRAPPESPTAKSFTPHPLHTLAA